MLRGGGVSDHLSSVSDWVGVGMGWSPLEEAKIFYEWELLRHGVRHY